MTLLSFASRQSIAPSPQTAASPTAQISSTPKPEDTGMPLLGSVEGVVVDPDGKPVGGAVVHETSDDGRPLGGTIFRSATTTDVDGKFVLDHVIPAEKVAIGAYKYDDYYENMMEPSTFRRPPDLEIPVVEVKPEQTVTGVRIRFSKKAGKLHWYARDAHTKQLVNGVFIEWCRKGVPAMYCQHESGASDYERIISPGIGISIQIKADSGLYEKWEYRNPKTGSRYFRAKSGETETVNVYLRKMRKPAP
jgi:hypothetical protein